MSKIRIDYIKNVFKNYQPVGEKGAKHFAVVLLLADIADEPQIIYEVRALNLDRQPGEVCLPGGLIEPGETPWECALRETNEELGIPVEEIEIIREIDSVFTTGGSLIHCFLGTVSRETFERIKPFEAEVAEIFTVPVDTLLHTEPEMYYSTVTQQPDENFPYDKVTGGKKYPWRGGRSPVPVYEVTDARGKRRIVWGLTGRMTKQFLEVLKCSD